jgi:hypothetical protein
MSAIPPKADIDRGALTHRDSSQDSAQALV